MARYSSSLWIGTAGSNLDMGNYLITNIGNAGTDFGTGGTLTLAGLLTANDNILISNTAPTLTMTDTTAAAKSLTVKTDANVTSFYESAGAAGSLLDLDLANNRVGIGTLSPLAPLHIVSSTPNLRLSSNETNTTDKYTEIVASQRSSTAEPEGFSLINSGATSTQNYIQIGGGGVGANSATSISFYTTASGVATRTGTQRLIIISDGSVGIGTSTPTQKLSVWDGNASIQNTGTLGSTVLTDGTFTLEPGAANWGVTGGWDASFTGNAAVFAIAGGAGNLTQAAAKMVGAVSLKATRWYKFSYTVSGVSSSPAATITTAVASAATSLTLTAGAQITYFKSAASPGTFTINATAGNFTLDGVSLQEVQGGDILMGGTVYAGGLNLVNQTTTVGAGVGTLTNAPTAGDPSVYLRLMIDGTIYGFPGWPIPA